MIKFFRKERLGFLFESKFGKYLLYAVGEIILVVIGILIALQINTANENRIKKNKEKDALIEIISDLDQNIINIKENLSLGTPQRIDTILHTFGVVIEHIERRKPFTNELANYFYMIHQCIYLDYKVSGYESLKSLGMDLILDNTLRSQVGTYYSVYIESNRNAFKELRDDFYNYMLDIPRKFFTTKQLPNHSFGQIPHDYNRLLEMPE
jgi:hypothetical protein